MINGIRLERFRGFRKATLELRRLTVLLGPNSAGKSCFGHALVGLKQVHDRPGQDPSLVKGNAPEEEWPLDFGKYEDLVEGDSGEPVVIAVQGSKGLVEFGFGGKRFKGEPADGLELTRLVLPGEPIPSVVAANPDQVESPLSLKHETPTVASPQDSSGSTATETASRFHRIDEKFWRADESIYAEPVFRGLEIQRVLLSGKGDVLNFPNSALRELRDTLAKLWYLGPCRASPRREYDPAPEGSKGIGCAGRWTADYLFRHKDVQVVSLQPPDDPVDPDDAARQLNTPWTSASLSLVRAVNYWMQHLKLARSVDSNATASGHQRRLDACVIEGQPSRPLTDVGFGLSQALPIIVAGLAMQEEGLLVVEQPEAQLHPQAQALLADFFCSLIKSGRRALVETHSEAFFHRLRLRAALDDELASQIAVYFVSKPASDGCCQQPQPVPLTDADNFKWPAGFLVEGLDQELCIAAARTARARRSQDGE